MTPAAFQDLALRCLEQPDHAGLQAELARVLAAQPELHREWTQLAGSHALAQDLVPALAALGEAPSGSASAPIPPARLAALLAQLPKTPSRSRSRPWFAGIGLAAAAAFAVIWWQPGSGKTEPTPDLSPWVAKAGPTLARALTAPLADLVQGEAPVLRHDATTVLRSPRIAAAAGPVTIVWTGTPAGPSRVTLRRDQTVIWTADTVSPAVTPPLEPGRLFELAIETPGAADESLRSRFVTVAAAPSALPSDDAWAPILAALTAVPSRQGDAVRAWLALPSAARHSETGTRIGLWLGLEAGQPDILAEAQAAARARLAGRDR